MMKLYRRRPETIEAEQWFPGREIEGVVMKPNFLGGKGHGRINLPDQPYFESDDLSLPLYPGDYITRSGAGRGVARKDYFEGLYEEAADQQQPGDAAPGGRVMAYVFGRLDIGDGRTIIRHTEDGETVYMLSWYQVWRPGVYESEDAARVAFEFDDEVLSQLQESVNPGGVVTMSMLEAARLPQEDR